MSGCAARGTWDGEVRGQASELAEISNQVRKFDQKVERCSARVNHSVEAVVNLCRPGLRASGGEGEPRSTGRSNSHTGAVNSGQNVPFVNLAELDVAR
ncbi:hypothetical protein GCM10010306_070960 [Streptomyces umbrinus]|nr:hypothetical protein GCM10010306_070960 [Streptomyces umbrinus]